MSKAAFALEGPARALGGSHGLAEDAVPLLRPDHAGSRQVDAAAEKPLELVLDADQAEVADRPVEFGDEVEVTIGPGLVAGDRAEDEERADAKPPEVVHVGGEELDGFSAAHVRTVEPGRPVWKPSAGGRWATVARAVVES